MTTVSQLVERVSEWMAEPHEKVNAYARALLNEGLLPLSKGRHIAHVDDADMVRLVFAVARAPKIKNTALRVREYLSLRHLGATEEDVLEVSEDLLLKDNFSQRAEDYFAALCRSFREEHTCHHQGITIQIITSWPAILVKIPDYSGTLYSTDPPVPEFLKRGRVFCQKGDTWKVGYRGNVVKKSCEIPGFVWDQLVKNVEVQK